MISLFHDYLFLVIIYVYLYVDIVWNNIFSSNIEREQNLFFRLKVKKAESNALSKLHKIIYFLKLFRVYKKKVNNRQPI